MKVYIIGGTSGETVVYTKVSDIQFAPDADMTNLTLPINDFECKIQTEDDITVYYPVYSVLDPTKVDHYGQRWVELEDDAGNKYFRFALVKAHRLDNKFVSIRGESTLCFAEKKKLEPIMYNHTDAKSALYDIFHMEGIGGQEYINSAIEGEELLGYCPEQTARERIQWICFVLGLRIKQVQTPLNQYGHPYCVEITYPEQPNASAAIETDRTYYRPEIEESESYSKLVLYYYHYVKGTPQSGDTYVKVFNEDTGVYDTYIQYEESQYLTRTDGGYHEENVLEIKGIYLNNNVSANSLIYFLASKYLGDGITLKGALINNNDFKLTQRVMMRASEDTSVRGYISKMDFSFGAQIKTDVELDFCKVEADLHKVTLVYTYKGLVLKRETYKYPTGFLYIISPKYIDRFRTTSRTVYYPPIEDMPTSPYYGKPKVVIGTVGDSDVEREVVMSKALYYNNGDKKLELLNMSDSTFTGGILTVAHKQPKQYRISVVVSPSNTGVVYGGGLYNEGDTITLSAVAEAGYRFDFWKEGKVPISESPTLPVTVSRNLNLVAQFTEAITTVTEQASGTSHTLSETPIEGTRIIVVGQGTISEDTITFTAGTSQDIADITEGMHVRYDGDKTFTASAGTLTSITYTYNG